MNETIRHLIVKNLNKLIEEISAYPNETDLWKVEKAINNSAGTLALHVVGNLNHFIGHILGGTDYRRDREFEFSGTVVSKKEIIDKIHQTINMVNEVAPILSNEQLNQPFEFDFLGEHNTIYYVTHFITHLTYHLGQINYHRRLLT